jgi:hypothetical protein
MLGRREEGEAEDGADGGAEEGSGGGEEESRGSKGEGGTIDIVLISCQRKRIQTNPTKSLQRKHDRIPDRPQSWKATQYGLNRPPVWRAYGTKSTSPKRQYHMRMNLVSRILQPQ